MTDKTMTPAEVLAVMDHEASVMADDNCPLQADRMRQARAAVAALVAERDALLTVRECLRRECDALRGENTMYRNDAERYRFLRNGEGWPAAFGAASDPEPLRGFMLDAAISLAQRGALAGAGHE